MHLLCHSLKYFDKQCKTLREQQYIDGVMANFLIWNAVGSVLLKCLWYSCIFVDTANFSGNIYL